MKIYVILNHDETMIDISNVPFKLDTEGAWIYDGSCHEWESLDLHKNKCDFEVFEYLRSFLSGPEQPVELDI